MTHHELKVIFAVAVVATLFCIPTLIWLNTHEPEIVGVAKGQTQEDQLYGDELNFFLLLFSVASPVVAVAAGIGILRRRDQHARTR